MCFLLLIGLRCLAKLEAEFVVEGFAHELIADTHDVNVTHSKKSGKHFSLGFQQTSDEWRETGVASDGKKSL